MTIAERIYNGQGAADLGMLEVEYGHRKVQVDKFLATWRGGDFDTDYRSWLRQQTDGDRGVETKYPPQQPTGLQIRRVEKRKPCTVCGGGKVR